MLKDLIGGIIFSYLDERLTKEKAEELIGRVVVAVNTLNAGDLAPNEKADSENTENSDSEESQSNQSDHVKTIETEKGAKAIIAEPPAQKPNYKKDGPIKSIVAYPNPPQINGQVQKHDVTPYRTK